MTLTELPCFVRRKKNGQLADIARVITVFAACRDAFTSREVWRAFDRASYQIALRKPAFETVETALDDVAHRGDVRLICLLPEEGRQWQSLLR